jgi:hypothetical protein
MTPTELQQLSLPDLIRHGLECLDQIRTDGRYRVDDSVYHEAKSVKDKKSGEITQMPTRVCWAGAIIALTLGADPTASLGPFDFPEHEGRLRFLNWAKAGFIVEAFECLNQTTPHQNRTIRTDPEGWRADMMALADELERDESLSPFFQGRTPHASSRREWTAPVEVLRKEQEALKAAEADNVPWHPSLGAPAPKG